MEFTYETKKNLTALETFEWDNVWWEQTEKKDAKRILYIGDSISCGTRRYVTILSGDKIMCDGFGTSKGLDNPYFKPTLELCINQQYKCDAILFNNGLHGWHLNIEEYGEYLDEMIKFLLKFNKPLYILTSTDIVDAPEKVEVIKKRNEVVSSAAKKYNLPVIDLFEIAVSDPALHNEDKVHFTDEGYKVLAERILEKVEL